MPDYDPHAYPPFAVTVDLVIFTIVDGKLQVLLVRRGEDPDIGRLALPGGFVKLKEGLEAAARRELVEETGIDLRRDPRVRLEQLATYGDPRRDSRMRVVSVAYVAMVAEVGEPKGGSDAADAELVEIEAALKHKLAFDHDTILTDGLERVQNQFEYTSIATSFCPPEFPLATLRAVYETVWGNGLDPANFRRKVLASGMVEPVSGSVRTSTGRGRPAQLYRAASEKPVPIDPPFRREWGEQLRSVPAEAKSGASSRTPASVP